MRTQHPPSDLLEFFPIAVDCTPQHMSLDWKMAWKASHRQASNSAARRDCSATLSIGEFARRSRPNHAQGYERCSGRLSGAWEVEGRAADGGETALARHCASVEHANIEVVKPFEGLGGRKKRGFTTTCQCIDAACKNGNGRRSRETRGRRWFYS